MKMCAWCGADLGPGRNDNREPESCRDSICDREVRLMYRQMDDEARERADDDGYERYR